MAKRMAVGIIGAGNIAEAYLRLAKVFGNLAVIAIADIVPAAAKARAEKFSVRAMGVDELLNRDEIDVVINLTVPDAHYQVSREILSAGKHAYSEKPLALNTADAKKLVALADRRGLKLGGAPDTFLGAGGQRVRQLLDKGTIGRVIGGSAYVMGHGMEMWHPNPAFFYQPGAGPVFDVGVYYITALVALLGAVETVTAMASKGLDERLVTSTGPMHGKRIKVDTPTNINAILAFANGAQITLGASWDVWRHGHANPIELYGETGTMLVPDPNFFAGTIAYSDKGGDFTEVDSAGDPFGTHNWPWAGPFTRANYRMLGVADLIDAAAKDREPRCSGRMAAHVVEVMEAILTSALERSFVKVRSTVERPAPLTAGEAKRLMAKDATAGAAA
jgi:predicted dehydrogenase